MTRTLARWTIPLLAACTLASPSMAAGLDTANISLSNPTRPNFREVIKDNSSVGNPTSVRRNTTIIFRVIKVNTLLFDVKVKGELKPQPGANFDGFLGLEKKAAPATDEVTAGRQIARPALVNSPPEFTEFEDASKDFVKHLALFAKKEHRTVRADLTAIVTATEGVTDSDKGKLVVTDPERFVKEEAEKIVQGIVGNTDRTVQAVKGPMYKDVEAAFNKAKNAYGILIRTTYMDPFAARATTLKNEFENLLVPAKAEADALWADFQAADEIHAAVKKASFTADYGTRLDVGENNDAAYEVTCTPRKETPASISRGLNLQEITYVVNVQGAGGWRTDSSAGFFFTFGGLSDRQYKVSRTSKRIFQSSTRDEFRPAAGAAIHRHGPVRILGLRMDAGPTFGLALNADGELQYMFGFSLFMGTKQRLVLSAGISGAQVKRLDGVREGQRFGGSTVPTTDVFRTGLFVGLTYNL